MFNNIYFVFLLLTFIKELRIYYLGGFASPPPPPPHHLNTPLTPGRSSPQNVTAANNNNKNNIFPDKRFGGNIFLPTPINTDLGSNRHSLHIRIIYEHFILFSCLRDLNKKIRFSKHNNLQSNRLVMQRA